MRQFFKLAAAAAVVATTLQASAAHPQMKVVSDLSIIVLEGGVDTIERRFTYPGPTDCLVAVSDSGLTNSDKLREVFDDIDVFEGNAIAFGSGDGHTMRKLELQSILGIGGSVLPTLSYPIPNPSPMATGLRIQTRSGRTFDEVVKNALVDDGFIALQVDSRCRIGNPQAN